MLENMRTRNIRLELKKYTIIYQQSNGFLKVEGKFTNYTGNHLEVHNSVHLVHSQCHIVTTSLWFQNLFITLQEQYIE